MVDTFELNFAARDTFGKAATRRLRGNEHKIPAVIYGAHQRPEHVMIAENIIHHALENEAFYSRILTININGEKQKAVLKKVQRDPGSRKIIHLDFLRVSATEKITMNVPLHFIGEDKAPGVIEEGGVVFHAMNEVAIRCLPANLPEFIEVDVSKLKLDESIYLSELQLPQNVELVAFAHGDNIEEYNQVVVSIHIPKEESETAIVAEGTETAEAETEITQSKVEESEQGSENTSQEIKADSTKNENEKNK